MNAEELLLDRIKLLEQRVEVLDKRITVEVDKLSGKFDDLRKEIGKQNTAFWKYVATALSGAIISYVVQYLVLHIH